MPGERRGLRAEIRARRQALSPKRCEALSAQLARRAFASLVVVRAKRIAAFMSRDGEVDMHPLVARLLAIGKRVYVPQIAGPTLRFLPVYHGVPLSVHPYDGTVLVPEGHFMWEISGHGGSWTISC